jgi:PAS domain S-box-containing protein
VRSEGDELAGLEADDLNKSREQLIEELASLRQRVVGLEAVQAEQRRVESNLRESEARLHQIASSLREVVWLRDTATLEILYVNPAYEDLWGRTCEEFIQNPTGSFLDSIHPEDRARIFEAIEAQYDGVSFDQEYRIVRPDGDVRWVWGRTFPIKNDRGEVTRVAALAEDITTRKLAERALRESESRYRSLFGGVPVGLFRLSRDGQFLDANPAMVKMLGCPDLETTLAGGLVGVPLHAAEAERLWSLIEEKGVALGFELQWHRHDGAVIWLRTSIRAVRDDAGLVLYYEGVAEDISQRKQAEEAERNAQEQLSLIVDGVPALIAYVDADKRYVHVNNAYAAWYGMTKEDLIGKHISDILKGEAYRVASAYYDQVLAGKTVSFENVVYDRQRRQRVVSVGLVPHFDEEGRAKAFFGLIQDVTEAKEAEATLRERSSELQSRNEELDAFAHTVAHDLLNPLSLMISYAEFLKREHAYLSPTDLEQHLAAVVLSGHKMANIVDELLLLAGIRNSEVEMVPLDMEYIVLEAHMRLVEMIDERQARVLLPTSWPKAVGYAPWVEEVWFNYISNALKYGGQPPCVELGAATESDNTVRYWVRDNGPGLTPEDQKRLFVPFTQLSQIRVQGHGLGLSIVRRIVEKLGGQVGVKSRVGEGSVFSFTLPGVRGEG